VEGERKKGSDSGHGSAEMENNKLTNMHTPPTQHHYSLLFELFILQAHCTFGGPSQEDADKEDQARDAHQYHKEEFARRRGDHLLHKLLHILGGQRQRVVRISEHLDAPLQLFATVSF